MDDYDDWVERLDPHARSKVEQMSGRITELTNGWRAADAERDAARREVELLSFCLDQARIALKHFSEELPDPDHRRIAEGALIASAPPGTLPGERQP